MQRARCNPSTPKMERKIIEKNRRNQMKSLYSKLYSLLPSKDSKEGLPPVPDQIDEARKYIEGLQMKLEMLKEKKERLLYGGERPYSSASKSSKSSSSKLTGVEVHEMGPGMDVVYLNGLEEHASFYAIVHRLSEQGFEVVSANFSINGNSMLQISYEKQGGKPKGDSSADSRRLKEAIYGFSQGGGDDQVESRLDLWDYEIETDVVLASQPFQVVPIQDYAFCNSNFMFQSYGPNYLEN